MRSVDRVVIESEGVDPERLMFDTVDTSVGPTFTTGEVAKFFFARSVHWLRWHERKGDLVLDGVPIVIERDKSNIKRYTLGDVEKIAHALTTNGLITPMHLIQSLRVLRALGIMSGLIY